MDGDGSDMTTHAPTIAFAGIDCLDIDVQVEPIHPYMANVVRRGLGSGYSGLIESTT